MVIRWSWLEDVTDRSVSTAWYFFLICNFLFWVEITLCGIGGWCSSTCSTNKFCSIFIYLSRFKLWVVIECFLNDLVPLLNVLLRMILSSSLTAVSTEAVWMVVSIRIWILFQKCRLEILCDCCVDCKCCYLQGTCTARFSWLLVLALSFSKQLVVIPVMFWSVKYKQARQSNLSRSMLIGLEYSNSNI